MSERFPPACRGKTAPTVRDYERLLRSARPIPDAAFVDELAESLKVLAGDRAHPSRENPVRDLSRARVRHTAWLRYSLAAVAIAVVWRCWRKSGGPLRLSPVSLNRAVPGRAHELAGAADA